TCFQISRWSEPKAYAGRCSCRDNITWQQRHKLADITYQSRNLEDHVIRISILKKLSIYFQPQFQIIEISNFIFRNEVGSHWRKCVAAFSFYPLTIAFQL